MNDKSPAPLDENKRYTNLNFLRELTKNNPDMIAEMINVYLEETPQLLTRIKTSLRNKDFEGIRAAAHSLIPSFSTMGIDDSFTELAKSIQDMAGQKKNLEGIQENLKQLDAVCEKAFKELREELVTL